MRPGEPMKPIKKFLVIISDGRGFVLEFQAESIEKIKQFVKFNCPEIKELDIEVRDQHSDLMLFFGSLRDFMWSRTICL